MYLFLFILVKVPGLLVEIQASNLKDWTSACIDRLDENGDVILHIGGEITRLEVSEYGLLRVSPPAGENSYIHK